MFEGRISLRWASVVKKGGRGGKREEGASELRLAYCSLRNCQVRVKVHRKLGVIGSKKKEEKLHAEDVAN